MSKGSIIAVVALILIAIMGVNVLSVQSKPVQSKITGAATAEQANPERELPPPRPPYLELPGVRFDVPLDVLKTLLVRPGQVDISGKLFVAESISTKGPVYARGLIIDKSSTGQSGQFGGDVVIYGGLDVKGPINQDGKPIGQGGIPKEVENLKVTNLLESTDLRSKNLISYRIDSANISSREVHTSKLNVYGPLNVNGPILQNGVPFTPGGSLPDRAKFKEVIADSFITTIISPMGSDQGKIGSDQGKPSYLGTLKGDIIVDADLDIKGDSIVRGAGIIQGHLSTGSLATGNLNVASIKVSDAITPKKLVIDGDVEIKGTLSAEKMSGQSQQGSSQPKLSCTNRQGYGQASCQGGESMTGGGCKCQGYPAPAGVETVKQNGLDCYCPEGRSAAVWVACCTIS